MKEGWVWGPVSRSVVLDTLRVRLQKVSLPETRPSLPRKTIGSPYRILMVFHMTTLNYYQEKNKTNKISRP